MAITTPKFLDIDEDYFDWAAPSLTLPGSTIAPFSSKNTLYSIEAFWGLVLFPPGNSSTIPPHLLRTLWYVFIVSYFCSFRPTDVNDVRWKEFFFQPKTFQSLDWLLTGHFRIFHFYLMNRNQALLGDIAGSLKLSLANISTLQR